jgi:hypothetical protein
MRRAVATIGLVMAGTFAASSYAARLDLNSPVKTIVTNGAEDRNELASELVVMLYALDQGQEKPIGAATIIGMNRDCLYLATANHVARDDSGAARALLARTRYRASASTPVTVLDAHDAAADLAALCLPNPEKVFIPFPRIPFFGRGEPTQLQSGDPLTFYGQGNTLEWHTKDQTMTYAGLDGDKLIMRGGGTEEGDSGGGLFAQSDVFSGLIGVILTLERAISIDQVTRRFHDWGLPVNLESWSFREANSVQSQEIDQGSLQIGSFAPPGLPSQNADQLKRLAVMVSGGPPGRTTGLLVAATDTAVWVRVPWRVPDNATGPRLKFATGFEVSGAPVPGAASADATLLTATVPREELVNLELAFPAGGFSIGAAVLTHSALRIPFLPPAEAAPGNTAYLLGVDLQGVWALSPRDFVIARTSKGDLNLTGGAIDPTAVGWLAFDDRNRLLGAVKASHQADSSYELSAIEDLKGSTLLPATAARLTPWRPLSVPMQVLAGGADPHCPISQALGYARNEESDDLLLNSGALLVAGRTHNFDYEETEDYTLKLDRWPTISAVSRAQIPGQKGPQRLVTSPDGSRVYTIGQVRIPGDVKNPAAEPHWCGFIEGDGAGSTLTKPFLFCGDSSFFLPDVALSSTENSITFAGGRGDKNTVVAAVSVARVGFDGVVNELFEDKVSTQFGGAARGADGAIYLAGYGAKGAVTNPVVVTKISPEGKTLWSVTDSEAAPAQYVRAITALPDGSAMVVGYAGAAKDLDKLSLRVWKISPTGTVAWRRDFALNVRSEIYAVISDGTQAILVGDVAWPDSAGNVSEDGWILAIDGEGQLAWQQTYSTKYALHHRTTRFRRVVKTPGGLIVLGEVGSSGLTGNVLWLVELQAQGLPRTCKAQH